MSNKMLLVTPRTIEFQVMTSGVASQFFKLVNLAETCAAFKIITFNEAQIVVQPDMGMIAPFDEASVRVSLLPGPECTQNLYGSPDYPDHFIIQSTKVPAEFADSNEEYLQLLFQKSTANAVHERKVPVKYLDAASDNPIFKRRHSLPEKKKPPKKAALGASLQKLPGPGDEGFWQAMAKRAKDFVVPEEVPQLPVQPGQPKQAAGQDEKVSKQAPLPNSEGEKESQEPTLPTSEGSSDSEVDWERLDLAQQGLNAVLKSLAFLGGSLGAAIEEGIQLIESHAATIMKAEAEDRASRKSRSSPGAKRTPKSARALAKPLDGTLCNEARLLVSQNVTAAMASKTKKLQLELRETVANLMEAKDHCWNLEAENLQLRHRLMGTAGGPENDDDELVRQQLERLLQEKALLAQEKAALQRDNALLHHTLASHNHLLAYLPCSDEGEDFDGARDDAEIYLWDHREVTEEMVGRFCHNSIGQSAGDACSQVADNEELQGSSFGGTGGISDSRASAGDSARSGCGSSPQASECGTFSTGAYLTPEKQVPVRWDICSPGNDSMSSEGAYATPAATDMATPDPPAENSLSKQRKEPRLGAHVARLIVPGGNAVGDEPVAKVPVGKEARAGLMRDDSTTLGQRQLAGATGVATCVAAQKTERQRQDIDDDRWEFEHESSPESQSEAEIKGQFQRLSKEPATEHRSQPSFQELEAELEALISKEPATEHLSQPSFQEFEAELDALLAMD